MAGTDVDALRRFYAAWTSGDLPGMLAEVDPAVEAQPVLGLLYRRPSYRGHTGIARWFEEVEDLWDGFEVHVEATHEVDGAVVALLRLVAHTGSRTSHAPPPPPAPPAAPPPLATAAIAAPACAVAPWSDPATVPDSPATAPALAFHAGGLGLVAGDTGGGSSGEVGPHTVGALADG